MIDRLLTNGLAAIITGIVCRNEAEGLSQLMILGGLVLWFGAIWVSDKEAGK